MRDRESTERAARFWICRAHECLQSAADEARAERFTFAINRCYYAAFYSASAVLLVRGRRFVKHSGLRAAVHRDLVKPGLLSAEFAKIYDRLFSERQQGDYVEYISFGAEAVGQTIAETSRLVTTLESLIPPATHTEVT